MKRDYGLRLVRKLYDIFGMSRDKIYANKSLPGVIPPAIANRKILQVIASRMPCMISRFGTTESLALLNSYDLKLTRNPAPLVRAHAVLQGRHCKWEERTKQLLFDNAGFFPISDEALARFESCYTKYIPLVDMLGVWGFVPGENYLIKKLCPDAQLFEPIALEPYFFEDPWSAGLEGKRVLVVHPFAKTITEQYKKRKKLFKNPLVLPDFELRAIPAVQSLAGTSTPFPDWFRALEWMQNEMERAEFDVAIVGAGAYGLPLCAHAKSLGKIGVHIGGATQILFGIRGKRWDGMKAFRHLFNDDWVRPAREDVIEKAGSIENGCYW